MKQSQQKTNKNDDLPRWLKTELNKAPPKWNSSLEKEDFFDNTYKRHFPKRDRCAPGYRSKLLTLLDRYFSTSISQPSHQQQQMVEQIANSQKEIANLQRQIDLLSRQVSNSLAASQGSNAALPLTDSKPIPPASTPVAHALPQPVAPSSLPMPMPMATPLTMGKSMSNPNGKEPVTGQKRRLDQLPQKEKRQKNVSFDLKSKPLSTLIIDFDTSSCSTSKTAESGASQFESKVKSKVKEDDNDDEYLPDFEFSNVKSKSSDTRKRRGAPIFEKENWLTYPGPFYQALKKKAHARESCPGYKVCQSEFLTKTVSQICPSVENFKKKACRFCFEDPCPPTLSNTSSSLDQVDAVVPVQAPISAITPAQTQELVPMQSQMQLSVS